MRTLLFLLQKEFKQLFRTRSVLVMILVLPVVQLIIMPLAADFEVKNIHLAVVDHDHSTYSQQLINKISASGYFKLEVYNNSFNESFDLVERDKVDIILEIPANFEKHLVRENQQKLFIASNAINGMKAGLGTSYLSTIIQNFNQDIRMVWISNINQANVPVVEITSSNQYNPYLNYQRYMVPGILAFLVTLVCGNLSSSNIVREKELGTIEQINVTPIKKYYFILGKLIPFWILGNVVFTLGLLVSIFFYHIVPEGNIFVLYLFLGVYLLLILGFGLLVSNFNTTQQQAMFVTYFFMMIFVMMSGLFTSIDSMPKWAKWVAQFNPLYYFVQVMRMIIIKGSTLNDILPQLTRIGIFAIILNALAVWSYKKTG